VSDNSGNVTDLPRCKAKKADGSSCGRVVSASQDYCYSHDNGRAAERKANASKAAKSKLSSEIVAVREEVRKIMTEIREQKLHRQDGVVLLQACNILLKTVREARDQTSFDEVRQEMAELRELFEANQRSRAGGGSSWSG
jgi:hypothetical protein